MMHLAGWAILVHVVLTAISIYQLIALEFFKWVIKAIDKIQRAFLWKGCKEVNVAMVLLLGAGSKHQLILEDRKFLTRRY